MPRWPKLTTEERFWAKVTKGQGCWLWTGARSKRRGAAKPGYGVFGLEGRRLELAHRYAWQLRNGPIPERNDICHRCDNKQCVRPSHLFAGTRAENVADMLGKGRGVVGERHKLAKLTAGQVRLIRSMLKRGDEQLDIASAFGVSQQLVSKIALGKRWRHLR